MSDRASLPHQTVLPTLEHVVSDHVNVEYSQPNAIKGSTGLTESRAAQGRSDGYLKARARLQRTPATVVWTHCSDVMQFIWTLGLIWST